jgi:GT2 family glycosyltransferase
VSESTECHPKVVAVVLTWNDIDMTTTCVDSLLASGYPGLGIVVVDNGTNPPSCPILKQRFPSIETVQLPENLGFTGGCNRGLTRAMELGADYIFLLNNDTIVGEQAIEQLVQAMERDARGRAGKRGAALSRCREARRVHPLQDLPGFDPPGAHARRTNCFRTSIARSMKVDFVPACAVMFRPQALKAVGLFDETLFTNWEDYDLCCRLVDSGWRIITVGTAEVVHAHGQTTGRISPFITYLFTRNRLICLFRYGKVGGHPLAISSNPSPVLLANPGLRLDELARSPGVCQRGDGFSPRGSRQGAPPHRPSRSGQARCRGQDSRIPSVTAGLIRPIAFRKLELPG